MKSARPRWSPTCSWCCAASRPHSRSSTPAPSTSDGSYGTAVTERKSVLLRLDPAVHDALARWAGDELRSTNAQIEFLLRRALADAGRRRPARVTSRPVSGREHRRSGIGRLVLAAAGEHEHRAALISLNPQPRHLPNALRELRTLG